MRNEWSLQSIAGGWQMLTHDPLPILAASALAITAQVVALLTINSLGKDSLWPHYLTIIGITQVLVFVIGQFARVNIISAGAQTPPSPVKVTRTVQLVVAESIRLTIQVGVGLLALTPFAILSAILAHQNLWALAAAITAIGLMLSTLLGLWIRACYAYTAHEIIINQCSFFTALRRSWTITQGDRLSLMSLNIMADVLVAAGGLLLTAGALPAYPMRDLALLHRWAHLKGHT